MNFADLFIRRKVMTTLIMLTIGFFGILSYQALPVSSLPDIAYPTIEVTVSYPGASPETIANSVVVPLEQQFATINGIQSISSTSYTGSATIVLQFALDKDIDRAAPDVQAAINASSAQLPQDLPYTPYYQKVNPTQSPILFYMLTSNVLPLSQLYDYAHSVLGQRLSIIEGVSQVVTYGQPFAVRIQLDPQKLARRHIGLDQIGESLKAANVYLPVGSLYGKNQEYTINVNGQIFEGEKYNPIVMKTDDGAIVRLRDVGKAFDSLQDDKISVKYFSQTKVENGVGLAIIKQSNANTLDVIRQIEEIIPQLQKQIPSSISLIKEYDESLFIIDSITDVKFTLLIALLLVVTIIFLYLGRVVDTIIPAIAIPISILGTFIIMFYCHFNIDILSLLAISLSIGFLVDDAIVVLENIVRHIEQGETPLKAAINGSKEIMPTIISMTLCLCCVFIPLVFMEGIIGRLLHEFSLTIATAVLISGFVSLSLTPLLCSKFIPAREKDRKKSRIEKLSEAINESLLTLYRPSLSWSLKNKKWILLGGICSFLITLLLLAKLPKDFLPGDDIGLIQGFTITMNGTSPYELAAVQESLGKIAVQNPNVDSVVTVSGTPQDNQGVMYVALKPFEERQFAGYVTLELMKSMNVIPGVMVLLKPMPLINLQVGTTSSKANYQYTMQSFQEQDLFTYTPILQKKIQANPMFHSVSSDLDIAQPQLFIEILRDKASMLGITAQQIETALSLAFAGINLSPINEPLNQYYVIMEVLPKYYNDPSMLSQLWISSANTKSLVPLSSVITMKEGLGPLSVNHFNGLPSATISFNTAEGVALGDATKEIARLASETLPSDITGAVQGSASVFKQSFQNLPYLIMIMIFIIYVVLGILYENFFPPLTVMSTLPPATLGGLLTLMMFGAPLSLYAVVGLILLLGIVLKNGIIMVDFANQKREKEGKNPHDAIYEACIIRFRPILMTTLSALMGAVPIALGMGGMTAAARRPLGLVIVGGLLISQVLTLYLTPVVYTYIEGLKDRWHKKTTAGLN